ncbi:alpha/beta hydrolase family esterase [Salsuginibacillus halophilus]|uniref:alpha/beta hydrolase family esterase n=1 Tax=Salsuginibacillus halophilus TaxID=517424 RepID=UPI0015E7AAC8|nr:PHB depolymerase family esterase [Salsuginibacillus halophilus]
MSKLQRSSLTVEGVERTYAYVIPENLNLSQPRAIHFSFHGAGSDADYHSRLTKFHELAIEDGHVVVYPEAIRTDRDGKEVKQWHDGTKSNRARKAGVDDAAFVLALIEVFAEKFALDRGQIYASGFSNGGAFSLRLAVEYADTFAAVGSVGALLAHDTAQTASTNAAPAVVIMGDKDPVVPYDHAYARAGVQYEVTEMLGAEATMTGLVSNVAETVEKRLSPLDLTDPTRVIAKEYYNEEIQPVAWLYTVKGGGHTWPGGPKVQPAYFGRVSQQLEASRVLWQQMKLLNRESKVMQS